MYLESLNKLEAMAIAHLLIFQTFSLTIEKLGDKKASSIILQAVGNLTEDKAFEALNHKRAAEGPFTNPQARWMQWELKQVGTETKLVLR